MVRCTHKLGGVVLRCSCVVQTAALYPFSQKKYKIFPTPAKDTVLREIIGESYLLLNILHLDPRNQGVTLFSSHSTKCLHISRSKNNTSCLFTWKIQQIQSAQKHCLIEHIFSCKTLFSTTSRFT